MRRDKRRRSTLAVGRLAFLLALAGGGLGCGSGGPLQPDGGVTAADANAKAGDVGACVWGTSQACTCDGGLAGESRCLSSGTFAPCMCAAPRPDAASGSDAASGPDAPPPDVPPAFELTRTLPISGRHLLSDRGRGRLYVTVGGTAAMYANSLVVIDPVRPSVLSSVAVGSEPGVMALSDDGSTLWVGIDGAYAIRRIDLRTDPPTPGPMYTLPRTTTFGDPIVVGSMVVLPGAPGSVMLTGLRGGYGDGLMLLDDGMPRGAPPSRSYYDAGKLAAGPSGFVFASSSGLLVLTISSSGFTATPHAGLIGSGEEITYAAGRLYSRSGVVVDVSRPERPVRAGQFGYPGMLVASAKPNRMIMLSAQDSYARNETSLRILDVERFVQTVAVPIKGVTEQRVWGLVSVGDDGVAFLAAPDLYSSSGANQNRLHVVNSTIVRDLP